MMRIMLIMVILIMAMSGGHSVRFGELHASS